MKKLLVLLVLPMLLTVTAVIAGSTLGPYWIGQNSDPEYAYLFNSLSVAKSWDIAHTDHPGTTLQTLGAVTFLLADAVDDNNNPDVALTVLKNPEFYLNLLNIEMVVGIVILLCLVGFLAYRFTNNLWLALLLQFSPFLSTTLIESLPRVSCEPMLLITCLLLVMALLKLQAEDGIPKSSIVYMLVFALISGFGLATKVTYLPLLAIPLLVLPRWREKLGFVILTVLSCFLFTLPIISQYQRIYLWFSYIINHTGHYGSGAPGIVDPLLFVHNLQTLFLGNPIFFLIGIFSAVLILLIYRSPSKLRLAWQDMTFRLLVAVLAAQFGAVLMVAKHSGNHYLLPALSLSGLVLFLLARHLTKIEFFDRFHPKQLFAGLSILVVVLCSVRVVDLYRTFEHNQAVKIESLANYQKLNNDYPNHLKIFYYRSSSPLFALQFGNSFANWRYTNILKSVYGEIFFFDRADGRFRTWNQPFLVEHLVYKQIAFVMYGQPLFRPHGDQLRASTGSVLYLQDMTHGEYETIYLPRHMTVAAGVPQP